MPSKFEHDLMTCRMEEVTASLEEGACLRDSVEDSHRKRSAMLPSRVATAMNITIE